MQPRPDRAYRNRERVGDLFIRLTDDIAQHNDGAKVIGQSSKRILDVIGKIASVLKPRHAVAYHFFNEEGTRYDILEAIRQTYDGPLSMAADMMVWNVTRDGIRERMAVSADNAWDVGGPTRPPGPDKTFPPQESEFTLSGRWLPAKEVDDAAFASFREKHGLDK